MLKRLSVRNYLLIDELELELDRDLTIITGETGSGKSIVIGALGLALGDRAEAGVARDPSKRCVIEVEAEVKGKMMQPWCERHGVPYEPLFLLRRQIDPGGRSRAFINDTPVRLEHLRELGERLVHIHSQHQTLLVNDPAFQLELVDQAAGHGVEVDAQATRYSAWRDTVAELDRSREEEARSRAEFDYLRFQLDELETAGLREDEQGELEGALRRAESAELIMNVLRATEEGLAGDDGVSSALSAIKAQLSKISTVDPEAAGIAQRLESARLEIADLAGEAARLASKVNSDPGEVERLRERLDLLLRLQNKHRVGDVAALIALREDLRLRTARIGSLAGTIADLEKREAVHRREMLDHALRLSTARQTAIGPLESRVIAQLQELGMPHARFAFERTEIAPGPSGIDAIRALFSANRDRGPEPLDRVASGGELSRVMLALISFVAESRGLPTVIFDEIDSGVSGEVAHRVGSLLSRMARERQVIAITHLPQIASKAGVHLQVTKEQGAETVVTSIHPVDGEERVKVLAQMLSGKRTGKAAVENARELLKGS
jgi:DNA repair protein RecN (Recombination protein N)